MNQSLKDRIESVWQNEIKASYDKGLMCSERHLQAELYSHLKDKLVKYCLWVEPTLELEKDLQKWKIKPDILITRGKDIEAIIEIKNVPYGAANFKDDINKMASFQNSMNKTFKLITDPFTGLYKDDHFQVNANILCVYAVIAKGDYAWAVENQEAWKSIQYEIETPKNFIHLVGRIFLEKPNYFGNAENDYNKTI